MNVMSLCQVTQATKHLLCTGWSKAGCYYGVHPCILGILK